MKIDLNQTFTDLAGNTVMVGAEEDTEDQKALTLGMVALAVAQTLEAKTMTDAAMHWGLSQKAYAGGTVEISPEECSLLRQNLLKGWKPMIAVPAHAMLGGDGPAE